MDSIYFEKQEGQLCAQHAINMLLQDHIFTAVDLGMIAQTLDTKEKEQLLDSSNYVSQHMDDTGYFSLQVIEMALKNVSNLRLINFESPEGAHIKANPTLANAFVLHLDQHWFAIRKFDTYLSLFLSQMVLENYHIFIVEGILPHCEADDVVQFCSFPISNTDNVPFHADSNSDIDSDNELQKAIAASEQQFQMDLQKREDEELKKALEESRLAVNNTAFKNNFDSSNDKKEGTS
ncbi:Machado-Joseph disease protein MJD family-containing protein [Strongyloides ratti]|uniref:ubiquitinyl hydrolase 1 n=1 Tax=Strongyloides ratti TaxID=34506 RepID=A0A090L459_STRRB|nr:Machado-Joseph disease protein MJD family-containing protein [Strongyloides ratti]CEF62902.1 Machado-Joseph disease protein MJD family-containing protein [Strongyloides ratti]